MKILAFADIHDSSRAFKELRRKVKEEKPDLIICAGDYTIFDHDLAKVTKKIAGLGNVFLLHGNHEEKSSAKRETDKYKNIIWMHKKIVEYNGFIFMGFGGGGFQYEYPEFQKWVEKTESKWKGKKVVLITHAPPHNTLLDDVFGSHVGGKTFKKFVQQNRKDLRLFICGHIHECMKQKQKIGNCLIVNPGADGMVLEI